MATNKHDFPFADTVDMFNAKIVEVGLDRVMNISILTDNKLKPLPYAVKRTSDTERLKSNDDVNILINEDVFDQLTPDLQNLVIVEALAYISFDSEKDKIVITQPDFKAHTMVMSKETTEEVVRLRESVKSILQAKKQAEDEAKAATSKANKNKN